MRQRKENVSPQNDFKIILHLFYAQCFTFFDHQGQLWYMFGFTFTDSLLWVTQVARKL